MLCAGDGVGGVSARGSVVLFNDPKHWRERAEEARANAEQISNPEARRKMYEIAESYDRLAQRAEERLAHAPSAPAPLPRWSCPSGCGLNRRAVNPASACRPDRPRAAGASRR